MPRKFERWAGRHQKRAARDVRSGADAKKIIEKIRKEANENGATLQSDGKGGVDPKIVLQVFRRDKWRCSNEHCPTPKTNLTLDHISGHPSEIAHDPEAKNRKDLQEGVRLGHIDDPKALHTLCAKCHDAVHAREREVENGKSPKPMRGSVDGARKTSKSGTA
jgi:hypothetical protein